MGQRQLKKIARKEALENFSSAELLDQLLVVITARSWILLIVIAVILAAACVWGFVGRIPVQIDGMGILIEENAPLRISNPNATGAVIERKVKPGDVVEAGSELLTIGNPVTQNTLEQAQKELDSLLEQDKLETAQEDESYAKLEKTIGLQSDAANQNIEQTRKLLVLYKEQVKNYEELSKQKLIPSSDLTSARATLYSAQQSESTLLATLSSYQSQLQTQHEENIASRAQRITQIQTARTNLSEAQSNRTLNTAFVAPIRCRIVSYLVNIGDYITPGTDVFLVVPMPKESKASNDPYWAIGYVPYGKGKEIQPGMNVQVAIPFASSTEYGFIKGTVSSVATFASEQITIEHRVGSGSLAKAILEATQNVPLELTITLERDASNESGFAWTSDKGFPGKIPQLSECDLKITTHKDRPINLVIPWFKQILGIDTTPEVTPSS